jgi:hypothetical protein
MVYYRPFASLFRGAEHTEGFIFFLFAEKGEKKEKHALGQIA